MEAERVIDSLKHVLKGSTLKDMYASQDRSRFAHQLLVQHVESEVRRRKPVLLPSNEQMIQGLRYTLEELADMEPAAV